MTEDTQDHTLTPAASAGPGAHRQVTMKPQQAFIELGRLPQDRVPLSQVLARVGELAQATIPGADHVSVTLIEGENARSVAFTGGLAAQLDERQYVRGFGPCMDAALGGETIVVTDTSKDERYPGFAEVAARAGVRCSASIGMPVPQRTAGALNLYSTSLDAFDAEALAMAKAFAGCAAVALLNAGLVASKTALATQLQEAIVTHAVIEQAKGLLMGRLGCSPEEASTHLSRASGGANGELRDVATQVLTDAQTQDPRDR
jgi:GAF domain-containing protein